MCNLFGGGGDVTIQPPPAVPALPPAPAPPTTVALTPEQQQLLQTEQGLLAQNLTAQQQQAQQQKETQAALEQALGMPLSQYMALQAQQQLQTGTLANQLQQQTFQQAAAERQAFLTATGMTPEQAAAQEAAQQATLSKQLSQRFQAALAGNLPVDPGLEQSLQKQEQVLRNSLAAQLGGGYETSTPGIQALGEFQKNAEALRAAARTGAISEAEQIGFTNTPATQRVLSAYQTALQGGGATLSPLGLASNLATPYAAQVPGALTDLYGQYAQGQQLAYQPALLNYQAQLANNALGYQGQLGYTNLINQANIGAAGASSQAAGALGAAALGAGGNVLGRYLSRPAATSALGQVGGPTDASLGVNTMAGAYA